MVRVYLINQQWWMHFSKHCQRAGCDTNSFDQRGYKFSVFFPETGCHVKIKESNMPGIIAGLMLFLLVLHNGKCKQSCFGFEPWLPCTLHSMIIVGQEIMYVYHFYVDFIIPMEEFLMSFPRFPQCFLKKS